MLVCTRGLGKQQLQVVIRAHRIAEQKALNVSTVEGLQECQLILGFDALGNDIHFQTLPHVDDRANNRSVICIHCNICDE